MAKKASPYYDTSAISNAVAAGNHRGVIGDLWEEIGNLQFAFLKAQGLRPDHTLLDIGCGCLRGGVHFIAYLDRGNYFGVDINQSLLDAGYDIELAEAGIQDRLPRENLACASDFDFSVFAQSFDFALAQSVFTHLPFNHIRQCLERLVPEMRPGGTFLATFFESPGRPSGNDRACPPARRDSHSRDRGPLSLQGERPRAGLFRPALVAPLYRGLEPPARPADDRFRPSTG